MDDKELLLKAIDHYDRFTQSYRILLKILIDLAIDSIVQIGGTRLTELSQLSKPTVYAGLALFEEQGFIECITRPKSKKPSYLLKQAKLNEIIQCYEKQEAIKNKYSR